MSKEQTILDYYLICHKLKDTIRTGWVKWGVNRDRLESVAEHIFGTQMLAIAMKSEYNYDIDIIKVIYMLAIHELGEALIGDFTPFDISRDEKERREHDAVYQVLSPLVDGEKINALFLEFDARETPEARFAYQCDKLECDLQCKLYDQEGCVDLTSQNNNEILQNSQEVRDLIDNSSSWSEAFLKYDQLHVNYDQNFLAVSQYVTKNGISNSKK